MRTIIKDPKSNDIIGQYQPVFNEIESRVTAYTSLPTLELLNAKYGFVPLSTKMNVEDLASIFKSNYVDHKLQEGLLNYQTQYRNGNVTAIKDLINSLQNLLINHEEANALSFEDDFNEIYNMQSKLQGNKNVIKVGFTGLDELELQRGYLLGILAGTGSGKSLVVQKHNALACLAGYKTLHLSIELQSEVFWSRWWTLLGYAENDCFFQEDEKGTPLFTDQMKDHCMNTFKQALKSSGGSFNLSTIDIEKDRINLVKVEKFLIKYKPDILYLDYVQLLDENFDPMTSKVGKELAKLAKLHNCLIIMSLQTNDAGSGLESPPKFEHIALCKNLKDDCDDFVAVKGKKPFIGAKVMTMEFVSRKERHGNAQHFSYHVDLTSGSWTYDTTFTEVDQTTPLIESYKKEARKEEEKLRRSQINTSNMKQISIK